VIWNDSVPLTQDCLAAAYLRSRSIDLKYVTGDQIRFHSSLRHPDGVEFPALVARVQNVNGAGCGIWRIFLSKSGDKARVSSPKMGLGQAKGGAVRIGIPGAWDEIALTEGIETALAVRQMIHMESRRLLPVWACLSTSGM